MGCPFQKDKVCNVHCELYNHDRHSCSFKLIGESLSTIAHEFRYGNIFELKETMGYIQSELIRLNMKRR